jgi:hypothetical protein
MAQRKPAIVMWDSSAAFLSTAGLDENSAQDVTRFYSQVLTPAARMHDAAVVVIDHDTKNSDPSRYARGSSAKLAATDVAYKIAPVAPFSKGQNGLARLTVTKDRRGWLSRAHEVTFTAGAILSIGIKGVEAPAGAEFRPTYLMGKICEILTRNPDSSFRDLEARVGGRERYLRDALILLIDEGYVIRKNGPRNSHLHELVVPFNG